jgi:mycoredoxin
MTMYTTSWCGFCRRLKTLLDREGIGYAEIDIERDPSAADTVIEINGGNRTVPTVVYPDGSTATNPGFAEVKDALARADAAS